MTIIEFLLILACCILLVFLFKARQTKIFRELGIKEKMLSETIEEYRTTLERMDFKVPVMDGYEAAQLIKKIRRELPVIGQTAYAFKDDKEKAFNAGCDDYITKPFQKDILIETISRYL
jgi:CheY-like chemotaxis protein